MPILLRTHDSPRAVVILTDRCPKMLRTFGFISETANA